MTIPREYTNYSFTVLEVARILSVAFRPLRHLLACVAAVCLPHLFTFPSESSHAGVAGPLRAALRDRRREHLSSEQSTASDVEGEHDFLVAFTNYVLAKLRVLCYVRAYDD